MNEYHRSVDKAAMLFKRLGEQAHGPKSLCPPEVRRTYIGQDCQTSGREGDSPEPLLLPQTLES